MKKLLTIFVCLTSCGVALATATTKEAERLGRAATILTEVMGTPEKAIPRGPAEQGGVRRCDPFRDEVCDRGGRHFRPGSAGLPAWRHRTLGCAFDVYGGRR